MKILNRDAFYKFRILEKFESGIVLSGAEVKSLRLGRADLSNSFIRITNYEAYLINAYIYPYHGQDPSYQPNHTRKLLLHKSQINSLIGKVSKKGRSLVPLSLYTKRNMFKLELGLGESKSKYDHRREIKEKDEQRRIEQELKEEI